MSNRDSLGDLTPFWVSGLALMLVAGISALFFNADPREARIAVYLALGTVFPAGVLVVALVQGSDRVRTIAELSMTAICVLILLPLLIRYFSVYALLLAAIQWVLSLLMIRASSKARTRGTPSPASDDRSLLQTSAPTGIGGWLVLLFATILFWSVGIQLLRGGNWFYGKFEFVGSTEFEGWAQQAASSIPILSLAFVLVLASMYRRGSNPRDSNHALAGVGNLIANGFAAAIFTQLSFRSDQWARPDFYSEAYFHWSYFIGPAEDIRQGGWLLWDVPSWYGFGNILLVAALPTKSCWHSMYLVNSLAILACASFTFLVLRSLRAGWLGWVLAFTVTVGCVFLLPGHANDLTGPQIWPSAAAFRFFWVYVLLAILWWGRSRFARGESTSAALPLGCLAWLSGVVWSFESAFYVSAVWLPAFTLIAWQDSASSARRLPQRIGAVLGRLGLLLLLLAIVGAGIVGVYWVVAGHAPDFSGYYEIAWAFRAYRDEAYAGPVGLGVLIVIFCAASTAVAALFRGRCMWTLALGAGAWAALWSTGSYMVIKAEPTMLLSGSPLIVTSLGLLIHLLDEQDAHENRSSMPRATFASVLIVFLALAFGNAQKVLETLTGVRVGYGNLASQLPAIYGGWLPIFQGVGVRPDDRVIFLGAVIPPITANASYLPWLPVRSWDRLVLEGTALNNFSPTVVPVERMREYVSRSAARVQSGGYIFAPWESRTNPAWSWLFDELRRTYEETIVYQTPELLLLRYRQRGAPVGSSDSAK